MEKENELLVYLASLGFEGEALESDVKLNMKLGKFSFKVLHTKKYGRETMDYELFFGKIHQFDSYRLEKYKATHIRRIDIEHVQKSEIDTARLEQQMEAIDWKTHFGKGSANTKLPDEMAIVMKELENISALNDQHLLDIRNKLMFKYWPEESFGTELWLLRETYTNSRDFNVSEYGVCNANLAYYIVSDRLGNLYEDLSRLKLDDVINSDVYNDLSSKFSTDPDSFELRYTVNKSDGLYNILIPIQKINDEHIVKDYSLELTLHPRIVHGNFNQVDTMELDVMMKEINWHRDRELFTFHENSEPEANSKVAEVEERMFRLALDPVGAHIADQLQIKYWPNVTFFHDIITQSAWEKFNATPKRQQEFPIEVPANEAMNLLAGRAVLNMPTNLVPEREDTEWLRFDLTKKEDGKEYSVIRIDGMSIRDIDNHLGLLPVSTQDYYPLRAALLRGDISPVTFKNGVKVLLEANPEQKTLNIFSPEMKVIPFNFHFDPGWKPRQQQLSDVAQKQEVPKQKRHHFKITKPKKNGPGKGRGI